MDTNKRSIIVKKPVIAPRSGKRAIVTHGVQSKNVAPRPNKQVKPIMKLGPVVPTATSKAAKPVTTCSSCVARRMAREQLAQVLKEAEAVKHK